MAGIVWSKTALNDLKNIANYIGKDSAYYAKTIVRKIYKAVSRLNKFPKSGRIIPEFKMNH
jgi:plasmid stabilization system protein ParE